jgi:hypothetical protein
MRRLRADDRPSLILEGRLLTQRRPVRWVKSEPAVTLASPNKRTGESHERKSVIFPG